MTWTEIAYTWEISSNCIDLNAWSRDNAHTHHYTNVTGRIIGIADDGNATIANYFIV